MSSTFFTTDDGDVLLRAGQGSGPKHDFRVHKLILSLASSVFKDMFAFPQPPNQNHTGQPDIPIVDVPDSPQVLDTILRFIYPGVELPKFDDLSVLSALLSATDKYNIGSMLPVLKDALKSFTDDEHFRVYIIACQYGFLEEAKAAAKLSTPKTIILSEDHEKDVRHISSVDLYRLLWFSQTREGVVRSEIRDFASLKSEEYPNPCKSHWVDGEIFYAEMEGVLQDMLANNPCVGVNELKAVLDVLPDPPHGCAPVHPDDDDDDYDDDYDVFYQIACPLRRSFIEGELNLLAIGLDTTNEMLLKRAFEKVF